MKAILETLFVVGILLLGLGSFSYAQAGSTPGSGTSIEGYDRTPMARASGIDVPTWQIGDSWTYESKLNNTWTESTDFVAISANVTYTVTQVEKYHFNGSDCLAYRLSISGDALGMAGMDNNITHFDGSAMPAPNPAIKGSVGGYRIVRVSDLAVVYDDMTFTGFMHFPNPVGPGWAVTPASFEYYSFDYETIDHFDFPIVPGESFNFNTLQNRTGNISLPNYGLHDFGLYSYKLPYNFTVTTGALVPKTVPAGMFYIYNQEGRTGCPTDHSSFNRSWSTDVKNFVYEERYHFRTTDHDGLVDGWLSLKSYHISLVETSIDVTPWNSLADIPVKVEGSFPGHPTENVIVTFPYTGVERTTTTDANGNFTTYITTPNVLDNTPTGSDMSSFGVTAYLSTDMNVLATTTVTITDQDDEDPIALGMSEIIDENTLFTFDGTGSSDNIAIKNFTWTFGYDDALVTLYGPQPSFYFGIPGNYSISLTVTDYRSHSDVTNLYILVRDITEPLISISNAVISDQSWFLFNGSGCYDPEGGTIMNWIWSFVYDATPVELYGERTTFYFESAGNYSVDLSVSDVAGNCNVTSFWVLVGDITNPVAVISGATTVNENTPLILDGSSSYDPFGGSIANYTWTMGTQPPVYVYNVLASYTFTVPGSYDIALTVTDLAGNQGSAQAVIVVNDITAPLADAGPDQTVDENTALTLNGMGSSDPDNGVITSYEWTFTDPAKNNPQISLTGANPSYTFAYPGTYIVSLVVKDAANNTATDDLMITVSDITAPVVVTGGDISIDEDVSHTFVSNASYDPESGTIASYQWSFNDNGVKTFNTSSFAYLFETPGIYVIELTLTDAAGNHASNLLSVTVRDITDPVAMANDVSGSVGKSLILNGSGSTDNVGITNYTWTFNDGNGDIILNGEIVSYTFPKAGTYAVTLTTTDAAGNTGTTRSNVVIEKKDEVVSGVSAYVWSFTILVLIIIVIIGAYFFYKRSQEKKVEDDLELMPEEMDDDLGDELEDMPGPDEDEDFEYICPTCGATMAEDDIVCPVCGEEFEEPEEDMSGNMDRGLTEELEDTDMPGLVEDEDFEYECPTCGAIVATDATVCPVCGEEFED